MAMVRAQGGLIGLCVLCATAAAVGQTQMDRDLARRSNELLVTYATFKQYPSRDPAVVHKNLSPDRRALFDAVVRALFVPIQDADGHPGRRVIDFVTEVRGIWGVRRDTREGRYMFRVSLRFDPGLRAALAASSNIPPATGAHVLLPIASGGDDDPAFTGFAALLKESGVQTFREASREPRLQVSMLRSDPTVGEVDIDYDAASLFCGCHCKPSNSDVGSLKPPPDRHVHLAAFNSDVPYFSAALTSTWSKPESHCKDTY